MYFLQNVLVSCQLLITQQLSPASQIISILGAVDPVRAALQLCLVGSQKLQITNITSLSLQTNIFRRIDDVKRCSDKADYSETVLSTFCKK